jgi:hypothetical protein
MITDLRRQVQLHNQEVPIARVIQSFHERQDVLPQHFNDCRPVITNVYPD